MGVWVRRAAAGVAALVIALVVLLVVLLATPLGIRLAVSLGLDLLNDRVLAGRVDVGAVQGSIMTGFSLQDLELRDSDGHLLLTADELAIRAEVSEFISGRIVIPELRIESPFARLDTTVPGTNWSRLVEASEAATSTAPVSLSIPWPLEAQVSIVDGDLELRTTSSTVSAVSALSLTAAVRHDAGRWRLDAESEADHVFDQPALLELRGSAADDGIRVAVADVRWATLAASVRGRLDWTGSSTATARLRVPPAPLPSRSTLLPRGASATVAIAQDAGDGSLRLELELGAGASRVRGRASIEDGGTARAQLDFPQLRSRDVDAQTPRIEASGSARLQSRWPEVGELSSLEARLALQSSARWRSSTSPLGLHHDLTLSATASAGRLESTLRLAGPRASANVTLESRIPDIARKAVLRGEVEVPRLEELELPGVDVSGGVEASFDGVAERKSWRAKVRARTSALRMTTISSAETDLVVTATGTGASLSAAELAADVSDLKTPVADLDTMSLRLRSSTLRTASFHLRGSGSELRGLDLGGSVTYSPTLSVDFDEGFLQGSRARWRLEPFRLQIDGDAVEVSDFVARSASGHIEADFEARTTTPPTGRLKVIADVRDLQDVDVRFPAGKLESSADVSWDAQGLEGEAAVVVSEIVLGNLSDPFGLGVELRAANQQLEVQVGGRASQSQRLEARLEVAQPLTWWRPSSWELGLIQTFQIIDEQVGPSSDPTPDAPGAAVRRESTVTRRGENRIAGTLLRVPLETLLTHVKAPDEWVSTSSGTVAFAYDVQSDPGWRVGLKAGLRGRLRAGSPDLKGDASVLLRQGSLTATVSLAGRGLGEIRGSYRAPLRSTNWMKDAASGRLDVHFDQVDLVGVRSLVSLPSDPAGTLSGRLDWDLGRKSGSFSIRSSKIIMREWLAPLAAELDATWTSTGARAGFSVGREGQPPLRVKARLGRDGRGRFSRDSTLRASWELEPADARTLLVRRPDLLGGRIASTGTVRGRLGDPRLLGDLVWTDAVLASQRFDRIEASVSDRQGATRVEASARSSSGGDVTLVASRGGAAPPQAHLKVDDLDLGFISELLSSAGIKTGAVTGLLRADVTFRQERAGPAVGGSLTVESLRVNVPGVLPTLSAGRLTVTSTAGAAALRLRAKSGSDGELRLSADLRDDGSGARLTGRLEADKLRYLAANVPAQADLRLAFQGAQQTEHFEIDSDIERASFTLDEAEVGNDLADIKPIPDVVYVETFGVRPRRAVKVVPALADDPLRLRINLKSAGPIIMRARTSEATASARLTIDVRDKTVRLNGETSLNDGRLSIFGIDYRITRGVVTFDGQVPPDPTVDFALEHAFETLILTAMLTGRASNPSVTFSSTPSGYTQAQLTAFFAGVADPDQEAETGQGAAVGLAGGALLGPLTRELERTLPIDTFDVTMGRGAPVATVGKWITDTIFVAFRWNFDQSQVGSRVGVLRWRFFPSWALEVLAGYDLQSADVFWFTRF